MFGVVLWKDEQAQKAVIWCEDHGDLAFYSSRDTEFPPELGAGDWVQFDMTVKRNQRFAHNPKVVSEGGYADLADSLSATEMSTAVPTAVLSATEVGRRSAQIYLFPLFRRYRKIKVRLPGGRRSQYLI